MLHLNFGIFHQFFYFARNVERDFFYDFQTPFSYRVSKKSPHLATDELLQQYMNEETYSDYFVNLSPYINDSGVCVPLHFSLHRAYILFRTLGLRHMTVVSHTNQVEGILTRKDLMGFAIGEKLERLLTNPPRKLSRSVVLALRKNYGHKHMQKAKNDNNANGASSDQTNQPNQERSSSMVHHKLISEQGSSTNGSTNTNQATSSNQGIKPNEQPILPPLVLSHDIESEGHRSGSIVSNNQQPFINTEAENNGNTHLPSETVINTNHLV